MKLLSTRRNIFPVIMSLFLFWLLILPLQTSAQSYLDESYWDDYYDDLIYDKEPSVWSATPSTVRAGEELRISGSFGTEKGRVKIDGENAKITEWFSSSIYVIVPDDIDEGKSKVTVYNKRGSSDSVDIYLLEGPEVTRVYPTDVVPGITRISIQGKNFGNSSDWQFGADTNIYINDIVVTQASWSDSLISFVVPEKITKSGKIEITVDGIELDPIRFTVKEFEVIDEDELVVSKEPNDEYYSKQYYFPQMNVLEGWSVQDNARGVVVAVIDDGVYINHPDLKSSIWKNSKEIVGNGIDDDANGYIDDIYGWDFVSEEAEMSTRGTHGTAVAGIIAASSDNKVGISGLAPGAKIMPLIACDYRVGCATEDIIEAIRYAIKNGADIVNLSLGSEGTTRYTDEYDDVINYARQMGVVVVAAAGNGDTEGGNGQNLAQIPVSPVCNGSQDFTVIGVAGVNEQNDWLGWSNYGDCVDVAAPAKSIVTTLNPKFEDGYEYGYMDGTSFAAPMVSALVALMKAQNPNISVGDLVKTLRAAAHNKSDYKKQLGSGWVDFAGALKEGDGLSGMSQATTNNSERDALLKQLQELMALLAILQSQQTPQ